MTDIILNTSPYNDDWDESKSFYRNIFNPGLAVQARELTQEGDMRQTQLRRFADNIFKDGSLVTGGAFIFDTAYRYIKIADLDPLSNTVNVQNFVGTLVTGDISGVQGVVYNVLDGTQSSANTKTLIVKYTRTAGDNATEHVTGGETLTANNGVRAIVLSQSGAETGSPYIFSINPGVVYAKGYFVNFPNSTLILDPYSTTPSAIVGFDITQSIVNFTEDSSLLDPANGTSQFAPGADRLKITATLVQYPEDAQTSNSFSQLFKIDSGIIQSLSNTTQYNVILDEMARRLEDQSGDYFVSGLNINLREHLNTGNNNGFLTQDNGGNSSLLAVGVDPGLAYVKGYGVQTLVTQYVTSRKGLDFESVDEQTITANYGNYVLVNELVGFWDVDLGTIVSFYDTAQKRLTNKGWSTAGQTGTLLGTGRIKAIELVSGTQGTPAAIYKIYLYNIKLTSGNFSSVKSLYVAGGTNAAAGADTVLTTGLATLNETNFNTGIYDAASNYIKSIRDDNGNVNTTYTFMKTFPVSIAVNGTFSISSANSNEIFPYSAGALNMTQEDNFIVTLNTAQQITLAGTVATSNSTNVITGTGTVFSRLNIGDKFEIANVTGTYYVSTITSNTLMTTNTIVANTVTGKSINKVYYPGDTMDFNNIGIDAGINRTITVNSPTSVSFDLKETYNASSTGVVVTRLNRTTAKEVKKTILRSRLVQIDTTTSNTAGPWPLGFTDVYNVTSIRKKNGSVFADPSEGTDATSTFVVDNGQRDTHYGTASLNLAPGASLSTGDRLLVTLDYFAPDYSQGVGYFSVDSYPIDDVNGSANTSAIQTQNIPIYVSPVTGTSYDLRNCIDTRGVKVVTATDSTTIGSMSTNPAMATTFQMATGGLRTPAPNQNFIADYSFYQPRIDIVVMDRSGNIRTIEGVSAANPITPTCPSDSMQLAFLNISPYPSLAPTYAASIGRLDLASGVNKTAQKRYTMVNIGTLDKRIGNLEYYQSLSLLEKATTDLKIPDVNGLDRFKNGIFVDPFTDHSLGDLGNPDFYVAVDPDNKLIRPVFTSEVVDFSYLSGTGVTNSNNVIILNYTETALARQPYATNTRNAAGFFYNFTGKMALNPATDYWVDTTQLPSIQVTNSVSATATQIVQSSGTGQGTVWNNWQSNWSGTDAANAVRIGADKVALNGGTTQVVGTTVSTSSNTQDLGNKVVDVSIIQNIRARQVQVAVSGLKPNTRMYPFFDGENVAAYCTPISTTTKQATGPQGSNLVTDALGQLLVVFTIPNSTALSFRVGDRVFRVTNSFNNGNDAITYAEATYSAAGLVQQKQDTFLTTTTTTTTTSISITPPSLKILQLPTTGDLGIGGGDRLGHNDPIGESIILSLNASVTSLFVTSIDLFFQGKDPNYGFYVELRQTDAAGNVTSTVIPYSVTYVPSSAINLSANGTVATHVKFSSPICLQNNNQYAFVVIPEANNPNTILWTAKLGGSDIATGFRVTQQPYAGTLFVSSNNANYSAIQDEDIKFVLYRAKFNPNSSGTVNIANAPREFLQVTSPVGSWNSTGETVNGETRLTQSSITGGSISVGQVIVGGTSGAQGTVTNITGSVNRVTGSSAGTFIPENATVNYANGTPTGVSLTISNVARPTGVLYKYNIVNNSLIKMILDHSTGSFSVGENIRGVNSNNTAVISVLDTMPYSTLDFESSSLSFPQTTTTWSSQTTSNNAVIDAAFTSINVGNNTEYNTERTVYGNTFEQSTMSGQNSIQNQAVLKTSSEYVSPIIDLNRTYAVAVHNIMNNDLTGETGISGGNAINKYISKKITLDDGQDAEDLKVYLTSYRPPGSDIRVYAKVINGQDSDTFAQRAWFELPLTSGNNIYSSITDKKNFIEFQYGIPASMLTGPNGEVQTTNSAGAVFTDYKFYQIKIVLIGVDSSLPPKASELRAIAMQL